MARGNNKSTHKDTATGVKDVRRASQRELAAALGKSASAVGKWQGIPRQEVGTAKGKRVYYNIPEVIEHLAKQREAEAVAKDRRKAEQEMSGGDNDLESGTLDKGMARYRLARAEMAEMDLAERRRELLPLEELRRVGWGLARTIRQAGEQLQREFGGDALGILDEALEEYQRGLADWLGDDNEEEAA
jgi:hypothetical protein